MPRYRVQAPDGRTVELEGDTEPTEPDLDEVFASLPPRQAVAAAGEPPPSPLKPTGPALEQGPIPESAPGAPPPRHGLIASTIQAAGFPNAAAKVEQVDQWLPGQVRAALKGPGEAFEKSGDVGTLAYYALNPMALSVGELATLMNPGHPIAAARGAIRGAWEDALPSFLSAENIAIMALSHGTGVVAARAGTLMRGLPGITKAMEAASKMGEVGETVRYAAQLAKLDAQIGRAAMLAKLGSYAETASGLGFGAKGGTKLIDAVRKGDWKEAAQAGLEIAMAGAMAAGGLGHRASIPGERPPVVDTAGAYAEAAVNRLHQGPQSLEPLAPGEPPPAVPESLAIREAADRARAILRMVQEGKLLLDPETVAALVHDAQGGIQPPAVATSAEPSAPGALPPQVLLPEGQPTPQGPPPPGGVEPVPGGEVIPTRVKMSTAPEVLQGKTTEQIFQEVKTLQQEIDAQRTSERAAGRYVDSEKIQTMEAELSRMESFLKGEEQPPLEEPSGLGFRGKVSLPGEPPPAAESTLAPPGAPPPTQVAGERAAIGEAPPGLSPAEEPTAPGEPPPTELDMAADAARLRLKKSAGLRGEGPTEAHAGLSTQNLKDMVTVGASKVSKLGRKATRPEWEAKMNQEFGQLPKESLDAMWEFSQDAAALGRVAGPKVAKQYIEEMAGPPKAKQVKEALGLGDDEGALAIRINNRYRQVINRTDKAAPDFRLADKQIQMLRDGLDDIVARGHLGKEKQAEIAKLGTAPREQTAKLPISEETIATAAAALRTAEGHAMAILGDLRSSGISIEESATGLRTGADFKGSPELRQALDAVLKNLFDAGGELGRAGKSLAVQKSTWARIGHRQQEALRLSPGLQAELEHLPGALQRLQTAGLELRGIQQTHFRRPFLTEMSEILSRAVRGKGQGEDLAAFGDDLRRMWRLQFSLRSFIMDVTSDAASVARAGADAVGHDAFLALTGNDVTLPRMRSFLDALRLRAGREGLQPVAGGIEERLGQTAYGETLRRGTALPAGSSWTRRMLHAMNREGAAGEATMRSNVISKVIDEFSVRGLYMKGMADTFTKRLIAQAKVLELAEEAGRARKLTGADLESFIESYRKAPPKEAVAEAARLGNDAGFNQELSPWERRWFRDNPIIQWVFDAFPGWALQHTRWLRDTGGYNMVKALRNPLLKTPAARQAEVAGALGQALAGWGAVSYVVKCFLPHVDPETGTYVDPVSKNRMNLKGIEPLATLTTLGYLALGDFKSAGQMWPQSSLPLGGALSTTGGGGILGGPLQQLSELIADPSKSGERFVNSLTNVLNRMIPGRPGLEFIKAFTDPISRRGLGAPIPGYSAKLPPVIDPATGKSREPRYELPILSDVLGRLGLQRDLPAIFGTQTPGAERVVDPVERLLERFDVPSAAAKRAPGIYRNIPDLPGDLSPADLTQKQRDQWREFFGEERQRLFAKMAADFPRLDRDARDEKKFRRIQKQVESMDAAAARIAVSRLLQADETLRPHAAEKLRPYTGPYADRPSTPGEPPPTF